ncbi:serine/threonine protein kinase [Alloacidobacterium dinghuense]|uniref:Serine/threonine protein kinase n=1 Tax=Alloacidobacterium dinghuense TaxID=2763107 RepID=A0A7G8BN47_9BACT|nr:serine/threonine-protein kinase [Alloacidobacterium dinghuense]QNI33967.1 serine/threonine protein kinase [Alloacidobacterium dinghuense]
MEPHRWAVIESLYERASELDPAERAAWLQQTCGDDVILLKELESLLACADASLSNPTARPRMARLLDHIAGQSDIDSQAPSSAATADSGIAPAATAMTSPLHSKIGPYRILRLLGEGGMGLVYEAEQEYPRRTVALKVIRSGLSDPKLVRRFEHELLALGRLQHPGIAQIYEAGTADNGFGPQPYFAMELVCGQRLIEYADAHQLTTKQRLELMSRVCEAVHHAHQRGIIHRDLKPGNILVDETGHPKILDFGVARVTDSDARMTHQTDVGQIVGTLAYMSPEQVMADPLELDTRSDVYSLGVVLYQLLARRLPYKISPSLPEAARTIQEEEPTPLSTISGAYRGDVETIVGKALEKDKTRRYSSAAELAADIRHYLHDEPIMARPASTIYQLQKFARRHKALVLGITAVFVVLLAGIIVSMREAARANRETATSRAISDFLQSDLLAQASAANQAQPNTKPDPDLKVRTALDRAAARISGRFLKQPEIEAAIRDTIGQTYMDLGLYPEARTQFERALDLQRRVLGSKDPETLKTLNRIGYSAFLQGKYPEAEMLLRQTIEVQRRVLGTGHRDTLSSLDALADVYWRQSKYPEAEALYSEVLSIQHRLLGPEHPDTLESMHDIAIVYFEQGKYPQAMELENQTLEIRRRVLGSDHPQTLASMDNLASVYYAQGKYSQAEALEGRTLEIRRRVLGPEHPETLMSMGNLANVYDSEGKYAAAETLQSTSLEITRRIFGPENSDTLMSMNNLANVYFAEGKYQQAEGLYTEAIQIQRRVLGPEHPDTLASISDLAGAYAAQGKYKEAEALYSQDLEVEHRVLGPEHPDFLGTISAAGSMYQREGKYSQAETYAAQALAGRRHALGSEDTDTMSSAADLALAYESQGEFAKVAPLARESMEFYENQQPDNWQRFRSESLLGASLTGQKNYAEAEPLLLEGNEGMVVRKERIAVPDLYQIKLARMRLIELYLAWGKPAKAAEWRKNLLGRR